MTEEESLKAWERYAIGAPGNWVDYSADRAPLLFIAGEKDHIMPPSVPGSVTT